MKSTFSKLLKNNQHLNLDVNENDYVVVRIWKPKYKNLTTTYPKAIFGEASGKDAAVGHVSLEIFRNDKVPVYLSHWPDFEEREKRNHEENGFFKQDVGKNNSLAYDLKGEGPPDDYIVIFGLDTQKMLDRVVELGEECPWTLKGEKTDKIAATFGKKNEKCSFSCSSYAHELLKVGGIYHKLLVDKDWLRNPIRPTDVGELAIDASALELKLYPRIKVFLKELTQIKNLIFKKPTGQNVQLLIDYARLYTHFNPNEQHTLDRLYNNIGIYHTEELLQNIKIKTYSLSKNLKNEIEDEIVRLIEKDGADPLFKDNNGHHSLHYAVINRHYNALKAILNKYPELVNHRDIVYQNKPSNPSYNENKTQTKSLLELAIDLHYDEIIALLIKYGATQPLRFDKEKQNNIQKQELNATLNKISDTVQEPSKNDSGKTLLVENLVFSGGGAAGYAYAGAIEALGTELLSNLKKVAGVSVGAIAALIVSLKYTPAEASDLIKRLDLKKFSDSKNPLKKKIGLLEDYGIYQGKQLTEFIKEIIKGKIKTEHPENVTFADLMELGFLDLSVIASMSCKTNGQQTLVEKVFSADQTRATSVVAAVRASASAPPYFPAVRMHEINHDYYVAEDGFDFIDGGLLNNYPIEIFDESINGENVPNPHTIGLTLLLDSQIKPLAQEPNIERVNNVKQHGMAIINGVLFQSQRQKLNAKENIDRTIQIDRLGVEIADFDIDDRTKENLVISGRQSVQNYFERKSKGLISEGNISREVVQTQNALEI